jgi:polysaccharide biosynthesis/export protein
LYNACRAAWISGLIGIVIQLIPMPAVADYLVNRGDVLEVSSSAAPELRRRTAVNDDGKISLPLIGEISVVDLSLSQLRLTVQDLLAAKNLIRNPDVTVEIVAYRPVYVDGAVASPGPYPYRPGLTVREVVALADGSDVMQLRNARGEAGKLAVELANQAVRVARLQAALAGKTEIDIKHLPAGSIAPVNLSEMVIVQTQQLKAEQEDYDKEKSYLERMIKATHEQIAALDQAQQEEAREVDQLQKDAARVRDLLQKGLVQISRVEDQQRAISTVQGRLFDVMARATGARKDLESLSRQLQEAGDKRKIKTLQQLEEALGLSATTRALLEATDEKLRYTGAAKPELKPELLRGDRQARHFVIVRKAQDQHQQRIAADEDTNLLSGDRVEVSTTTTAGALSIAPAAAGAPAPAGARSQR